MHIKIDVDLSAVERWASRMQNETIRQAQASAVNKLLEQAQTAMRREIASEFNVSASFVRARLRIRRASARGAAVVIEGFLTGGGAAGAKRSTNIIHFVKTSKVSKAEARRRTKAGEATPAQGYELRAKIKRHSSPKILRGAFIGNKGRTVFIREGRTRLPIKPVQTIDVPQMFNARRINDKVVALVRAKGKQQLEHELRYFMAR